MRNSGRGILGLVLCVIGLAVVAGGCDRLSHDAATTTVSQTESAAASISSAESPAIDSHAISDDATAAQDWPNLFGPRHDSVAIAGDLNLDWSAAGPVCKWRCEAGAGYSSPVVQGNRLILFHRVGDEELVDCLDTLTGERIWRAAGPTSYKCSVNYSNGSYSTPVIDQDRVYAWGADGDLRCLDLADGHLVWQRSLNKDYEVKTGTFPVAASPLVEENLLILNVGGERPDSGIVAVDKSTGATVWSATQQTAGYATPRAATIHNRRHLFVFTADGLVSLDPKSGKVAWSIPFAAKNRQLGKLNACSPVVEGDIVAVSAYSAGCLAMRILPDGSYQELWRGGPRVLDSQYTNLTASEGVLYGYTSLQRSFRALDLKTGEVVWNWPSDLGRGAMFVLLQRQFIMFGELGHLAVLDARDRQCQLRCVTKDPVLESPCYSAPALADGLLYVRNEKELACFDLRRSADRPANEIAQARK